MPASPAERASPAAEGLLRVAALQLDVREGEPAANLAAVEDGLRRAHAAGAALVVLPEMWPTSFVREPGEAELAASAEALAQLAALARELGLVVAGSAYAPVPGRAPANRLHVIDRGALALAYDKVHLFSPTAEDEGFSAGERPPGVADTSAGRLSGVVCYDLRFPEVTRAAFRAGAELLVVPAQWPDTRASHWRALVVGRAVESQAFVVACNRRGSALIGRRRLELAFPGNSLIVAPSGEVLAEGQGEEGPILADLDLAEARRTRSHVPVAKDERRALYRAWLDEADTPG